MLGQALKILSSVILRFIGDLTEIVIGMKNSCESSPATENEQSSQDTHNIGS